MLAEQNSSSEMVKFIFCAILFFLWYIDFSLVNPIHTLIVNNEKSIYIIDMIFTSSSERFGYSFSIFVKTLSYVSFTIFLSTLQNVLFCFCNSSFMFFRRFKKCSGFSEKFTTQVFISFNIWILYLAIFCSYNFIVNSYYFSSWLFSFIYCIISCSYSLISFLCINFFLYTIITNTITTIKELTINIMYIF